MTIAFDIASIDQEYYLGCSAVNNQGAWTSQNLGYMLSDMSLAKRLQERMDELGYTQDVLAMRAGVSQTTIFKLTSGKAKESRKILQIASALGVSPHWLTSGQGSKFPRLVEISGSIAASSNVSGALSIGKMIPLISWVQAGLFCGSPDLFHPGDCEEQIPCPKKVGPHTYALRVKGDSMVSDNPGGKSYPEGTIIYVDPDREVTNGCKVVVRIHDAEESTFKKFSEDAGRRYLRPLNKAFPTIPMDDSMHICGVVVGSWIDE